MKSQVRLQTRKTNPPQRFITAVKAIIRNEGSSALYSGISASMVRQLKYSSIQFGFYEECKYRAGPNSSAQVLLATTWCSGFAGGIGGNFDK